MMIKPFQFIENLEGSFNLDIKLAQKNSNIWWGYYCLDSRELSPYGHRKSDSQIYLEYSNPIARSVNSFREECEEAARQIRNDFHDEEISILLSGGLDSQIVLLSFVLQGIEVTPYIFNFLDGYNDHDTKHAIKLCEKYNLNYKLIQVDIKKWLNNYLPEYASPLKSSSPQLAFHYWMIDQVPGIPILGEGRISPRRNKIDDVYYRINFFESCGEKWGSAQWMLYKKRSGVPKFFRYTAELEYAYATHRVAVDYVNISSKVLKIRNFKFIKPFLYQSEFPVNYIEKYTGFEKVNVLDVEKRNDLKASYPTSNSYCSYEWCDFLKIKKGEIDHQNLKLMSFNDAFPDLVDRYEISDQSSHYILRSDKYD